MARRRLPLRVKIALAGIAGVGVAWLIPKAGTGPAPAPSPSTPTGITAESAPLETIPEGVSARSVGEIRLFLVRSGDRVVGLHVRSTAPEGGRVWWCPRTALFEAETGNARYDRDGFALGGSAPENLLRLRVLVSAGQVTIFPMTTERVEGASATPLPSPLPAPCSGSERVG